MSPSEAALPNARLSARAVCQEPMEILTNRGQIREISKGLVSPLGAA